jgi:Flp pilus assembly protein protease CpaA
MNSFEILTIIDIARFIPLILLFAYAGWQDHKTGEVSNKVWLYSIIGAVTMITEYMLLAPNMIPLVVANSCICIITAYILFSVKHGWGGADTKALITLGLCYPVAPTWLAWLSLYPIYIFGIAGVIAVIAMLFFYKQNVPLVERKIRFLPYVFVGLIIMAFLYF